MTRTHRRRMAHRLLMIGFDGTTLPDYVGERIDDGLGGVILFGRNIETLDQLIALNGAILGRGKDTLLGVDEEGGRVRRLRGITTDLPPMRQLGACDDPDLSYRMGALLGRELAALGFSIDFAPILDVHTNDANPVIGDRAFAGSAAQVIRTALPFARGLQSMGVAACGKHFPGHGDTDTDSHLALPVLEHDEQRLADIELAPFRAAAATDLAAIMTAHVLVPAWNEAHPSTLDPKALGILRRQYRYPGLIISDDLEMAAVADRYSMRQAITLGVEAGVDLFLVCKRRDRVEEALDTLVELAESSTHGRMIAAAAERVERVIKKYVGAPAAPRLDDARAVLRQLRLPAALLASGTGHDPTERT
jgi:beta-N-acetylhexosaminidase